MTTARAIFVITTLFLVGISYASDDKLSDKSEIASVVVSSHSDLKRELNDSFTAIGSEDETINFTDTVLHWLFMVPDTGIDPSRPIATYLLTPEFEGDIPDRAAIIPLDTLSGALMLGNELERRYSKIVGDKVFCCTENKDDPNDILYIYITKTRAFAASSSDALRWIIKKIRDDKISDSTLKRQSTIQITIDGAKASALIDLILPPDADIPYPYVIISHLSQLLATTKTTTLNINSDLHQWQTDITLSFPDKRIKGFNEIKSIKAFEPLSSKERYYSCSAGYIPLAASVLPKAVTQYYDDRNALSIYMPFRIIPAISELNKKILPTLTGIRYSAFINDPIENKIGKIEIYQIKDLQKATQIISGISSITNKSVRTLTPRTVGKTTIQRYTSATSYVHDNFTASALTHIFNLNNVEMAIKNKKLYIASGNSGLIEYALKDKKIALPTYEKKDTEEKLIGIGEINISEQLHDAAATKEGLSGFSDEIPYKGQGIAWRLYATPTSLTYSLSVSTSELVALKMFLNADTSELSNYLLNHSFNE